MPTHHALPPCCVAGTVESKTSVHPPLLWSQRCWPSQGVCGTAGCKSPSALLPYRYLPTVLVGHILWEKAEKQFIAVGKVEQVNSSEAINFKKRKKPERCTTNLPFGCWLLLLVLENGLETYGALNCSKPTFKKKQVLRPSLSIRWWCWSKTFAVLKGLFIVTRALNLTCQDRVLTNASLEISATDLMGQSLLWKSPEDLSVKRWQGILWCF